MHARDPAGSTRSWAACGADRRPALYGAQAGERSALGDVTVRWCGVGHWHECAHRHSIPGSFPPPPPYICVRVRHLLPL